MILVKGAKNSAGSSTGDDPSEEDEDARYTVYAMLSIDNSGFNDGFILKIRGAICYIYDNQPDGSSTFPRIVYVSIPGSGMKCYNRLPPNPSSKVFQAYKNHFNNSRVLTNFGSIQVDSSSISRFLINYKASIISSIKEQIHNTYKNLIFSDSDGEKNAVLKFSTHYINTLACFCFLNTNGKTSNWESIAYSFGYICPIDNLIYCEMKVTDFAGNGQCMLIFENDYFYYGEFMPTKSEIASFY